MRTLQVLGPSSGGIRRHVASLTEGLYQRGIDTEVAGPAGVMSGLLEHQDVAPVSLGPEAPQIRAALAEGLSLGDPGRSWHSDRTPVLRIADWFARVSVCLGKLGNDVIGLSQSSVGEINLSSGGASSTMPQKQNPVAPATLVALWHMQSGLTHTLQSAAVHRHQRDGAAWFTEWMCLPQIVLGAASAARIVLSSSAGKARSTTSVWPPGNARAHGVNGSCAATQVSWSSRGRPRPAKSAST